MYFTFKDIQGCAVKSFEQDIVGHVRSFYIDDETWTVRYIVINTILSPEQKSAIITPIGIERIVLPERMITLSLKTDQILKSPEADDIMPLSREQEIEFSERYEWPVYWTNLSSSMPGVVEELADAKAGEEPENPKNDLRDLNEMTSYHLSAQGSNVGVVDDFIIADETWHTAFVIVDTSPILPNRHVMLPPRAISDIDWKQKSITTAMTAGSVKKAPSYTADTLHKLQADEQ